MTMNGLPRWLGGKESACDTGDTGLIPGSGRSPEGRNGNPLQYSCLENSMDRGAWWATIHGVTELDPTEHALTHTHTHTIINTNYTLYETDFIMQFILLYKFYTYITSPQKALCFGSGRQGISWVSPALSNITFTNTLR